MVINMEYWWFYSSIIYCRTIEKKLYLVSCFSMVFFFLFVFFACIFSCFWGGFLGFFFVVCFYLFIILGVSFLLCFGLIFFFNFVFDFIFDAFLFPFCWLYTVFDSFVKWFDMLWGFALLHLACTQTENQPLFQDMLILRKFL